MPSSDHLRLRRFIAQIYRDATVCSPGSYQLKLFGRLQSLLPYDAAMWVWADRSAGVLAQYCGVDMPDSYFWLLQEKAQMALSWGETLGNEQEAFDPSQYFKDEDFYSSEYYRQLLEPYGLARFIRFSQTDPDTGLTSMLFLFSHDRSRSFDEGEKRAFEDAASHMVSGFKICLDLHMRYTPRMKRNPGAVCGADGSVLRAADGFRQHVTETAPHLLDDTGRRMRITDLKSSVLKVSNFPDVQLRFVELRADSPLDALSDRERELAVLVASGTTIKDAAALLGMAPGTASSHAHRIYRKLKVKGRSGLATLLNRSIDAIAGEIKRG